METMDRLNGHGSLERHEAAVSAEAPPGEAGVSGEAGASGEAIAALEHWAYEVPTPFLPPHRLLEAHEANEAASAAPAMEAEDWSASPAQIAFRDAVLAAHLARSRQRKGPPG